MTLPSKQTRSYTTKTTRQRRLREKIPCFFLIVEGQTEKIYFKHFSTRKCRVEIYVGDSGNPKGLVDKAETLLESGQIDLDEKDELWCVFDRDDNGQESIDKAIKMAQDSGFRTAFSNPCFEIWFLWHFEETYGYRQSSQNLQKELEPHLGGYQKTVDYFDRLSLHMNDAISRAKIAEEKHLREGKKEHTRDFNPSSEVFKIIEAIQKFQKVGGN